MQRLRVNNQIRVPRVNLIDENGKQMGVVETYQALRMAEERNLDLVEVVPNQWPPVAKIMDFGKYQYDKIKRERSQRSKQEKSKLKGVRVGFRTGAHDLKLKAEQIDGFLKKGHKVKIEMQLKGREKALEGFARKKISDFLSLINEPHKTEQELKKNPAGFVMIISKQ